MDEFICKRCGGLFPAAEIQWHHPKPRSRGGKRTVPYCRACHVAHHSEQGDFAKWGREGGHKTQTVHKTYLKNLKPFRKGQQTMMVITYAKREYPQRIIFSPWGNLRITFAGDVLLIAGVERDRDWITVGGDKFALAARLRLDKAGWRSTIEKFDRTAMPENLGRSEETIAGFRLMVDGWLAEHAKWVDDAFPLAINKGRAIARYNELVSILGEFNRSPEHEAQLYIEIRRAEAAIDFLESEG